MSVIQVMKMIRLYPRTLLTCLLNQNICVSSKHNL